LHEKARSKNVGREKKQKNKQIRWLVGAKKISLGGIFAEGECGRSRGKKIKSSRKIEESSVINGKVGMGFLAPKKNSDRLA